MLFSPCSFKAAMLLSLFALGSCGGGQTQGSPAAVIPPVVVPDTSAAVPVPPPEIRILVIGQSISSNCNEKVYGASPNVFQVSQTGDITVASDPFDWADCKQGSMWMPLGKMLIDSRLASKVTFMPIGIGSTAVADWLEGGRAYSKLNAALNVITQRGIQFDYALWHQGSSDSSTRRDIYASRLKAVIAQVGSRVKINNWLIAIHSRCYGVWDREVESAQLDVSAPPNDNIFPGPDNNSLDDTYRTDTCHLNAKGQDAMARLWIESMKNAK